MHVYNLCGIRLSGCGNSTPALAHNLDGGLHVCKCVCVFAASILLSDCHLQSSHTCTHKLSYKCVVQTFGTANIYLFSDVTGVQLMLFFKVIFGLYHGQIKPMPLIGQKVSLKTASAGSHHSNSTDKRSW